MVCTEITYQLAEVVNAPTWRRFILLGFHGRPGHPQGRAHRVSIDGEPVQSHRESRVLDDLEKIVGPDDYFVPTVLSARDDS